MDTDLLMLDFAKAGKAFRSGELTSTALVTALLDRIGRLDRRSGAFIEVTARSALHQAEVLDKELRDGHDRGPLHGVPIAVKDLFDVVGVRTTAGSKLLAASLPANRDALVVGALRRAGAVFLGKNNMEEFAAGMTGHNATYGDMHNPWDIRYSAGGSSGGTAVAVAAGMSLAGIGSDTGGSVRFPASACGLIGVRPTRGLISLEGVVPRSASLDAAGPIARTVDDANILLSAMCGGDARVYATTEDSSARVASTNDLSDLRVATVEGFTFHDVDSEIDAAVHDSLHIFATLGARVDSVRIPSLGAMLDHKKLTNMLLYEFRQHFIQRYGSSCQWDQLGSIVRSDLKKAEVVTESEYEEALAIQAAVAESMRGVFKDVDILLTPTLSRHIPLLTEGSKAYIDARRFLLPISFIGWPSITVPCGVFTSGLPIGLQVIGDYFSEMTILRAARVVERELWSPHRKDIKKRIAMQLS